MNTNSNTIDINDIRNVLLQGFEILKLNICNYIEANIKRVFNFNDQWVQILYKDKKINITDLYDPNCFLKTTDIKYLLTLYSEYWDAIFKNLVGSTYTLNLCQLIYFNLEQLLFNYKFNIREVYRCIDFMNIFLEDLGQNTNQIENLREQTFSVLYANPK